MEDLFGLMGVVIFFVVLFYSDDILVLFRENRRHRHIERMAAQLPDAERGEFVRTYLSNPGATIKKLAETNENQEA